MATCGFRVFGSLLVIVHTSASPTDAEWRAFLEPLRALPDKSAARILVWTEGGAPNTLQRELLNRTLAGATPRIAVLSSSPLIRGAATAISWFNPALRVFAPTAADDALAYLDVVTAERARARGALNELRGELLGAAALRG